MVHCGTGMGSIGNILGWATPRRLPWLALVAAVSGCGNPADRLPPIPPAPPATTYHLGPSDQLRIITFGEEQLTGEFRVGATGDIALPLIGRVHAASLTAPQLERNIEDRMRTEKGFRDPNVVVEVVAYRPIFVLGEVAKPGEYPFSPGMTAIQSVAVAGGFTYRAIENEFSIIREEGDGTASGKANPRTPLQPGDVVTVYERHF